MASVRIAEKKIWVDEVGVPLLSGEIHYWRLDPANWGPVLKRAREMGLQAGMQYTVGYTEQRGLGYLTVIGLLPSSELMLLLHKYLNVHLASRSLTSQVSTALFRRNEDFFLIAVNDGNEDKVAEVVLDVNLPEKPGWKGRNLVTGQEWHVHMNESNPLTFTVPRKDGTILHLQGV